MTEKTATRLFVEPALSAGASIGLSAGQAHYLKHVLRLQPGAVVGVFNGRDGEWSAKIDGIGKGWASLGLQQQTRAQVSEPDIWLVFAPIKRARIDFTAQKATELGASALWPVFTQHTVVERVNIDRLRANAVEAAEQTGRLSVPQVWEPVSLEQLIAAWPAERQLLLCDESGHAEPIAAVLAARRASGPQGPSGLMIGPEGGFAERELDRLRKLPFVTPVGLGARLLRADTAALAALACWQAIVGDWS